MYEETRDGFAGQFEQGYADGYKSGYKDGKSKVSKALKRMCQRYKEECWAHGETIEICEGEAARSTSRARRQEAVLTRMYEQEREALYERDEAIRDKEAAEDKVRRIKRI